jgi:hypothetical protein
MITCSEGENGTQKFKSLSVEIGAGEITYKGHTVSASILGEVYIWWDKVEQKDKTAVRGTLDVEWSTDWNKGEAALGKYSSLPGPKIRHPSTVRMLRHGEVADLGDTSAYLKLMMDSRNGAIVGRVGFEHYIDGVGTIRGEAGPGALFIVSLHLSSPPLSNQLNVVSTPVQLLLNF